MRIYKYGPASGAERRFISALLCSCLTFSLTACANMEGNGQKDSQPMPQLQESIVQTPVSAEQEQESVDAEEDGQETQEETSGSNILIAYFTWADNTEVEDADAAIGAALSHYESVGDRGNYEGVDATTSASVIAPGNTAQMAGWIQERTGGDLFSIVTEEPYPSDYDECLDRAANEKAENARPKLGQHVENMEEYDVVFLGYPNWWYTAPMAVFSLIEEYDFSGKTVIPFCAHGTGGLAGSVKDIAAALPDSTEVLEPIGVYRADIHAAQPAVDEWLDSLGYTEENRMSREQEDTSAIENSFRQVRIIIDGQECVLTLENGRTADSLFDMLPLELEFEDFNGTEKISYTPQPLTIGENDGGHAPAVGDLCVYVPWGNLCIFYHEFHYSDDLIYLGHIDTGMDVIAGMEGGFSAALEDAGQ